MEKIHRDVFLFSLTINQNFYRWKKYRTLLIFQINENFNVRHRSISDNIWTFLIEFFIEILEYQIYYFFFFWKPEREIFFFYIHLLIKFKRYLTKLVAFTSIISFYLNGSTFFYSIFILPFPIPHARPIADPHYLSHFETRTDQMIKAIIKISI